MMEKDDLVRECEKGPQNAKAAMAYVEDLERELDEARAEAHANKMAMEGNAVAAEQMKQEHARLQEAVTGEVDHLDMILDNWEGGDDDLRSRLTSMRQALAGGETQTPRQTP